jgi:hypothetical protein
MEFYATSLQIRTVANFHSCAANHIPDSTWIPFLIRWTLETLFGRRFDDVPGGVTRKHVVSVAGAPVEPTGEITPAIFPRLRWNEWSKEIHMYQYVDHNLPIVRTVSDPAIAPPPITFTAYNAELGIAVITRQNRNTDAYCSKNNIKLITANIVSTDHNCIFREFVSALQTHGVVKPHLNLSTVVHGLSEFYNAGKRRRYFYNQRCEHM